MRLYSKRPDSTVLCRYGVPGSDADGLEKVAEKKVFHQAIRNSGAEGLMRKSDAASETQRVLLGKTTMFSPKLLMDAGALQLLHQKRFSRHLDAICSLLCDSAVTISIHVAVYPAWKPAQMSP